MTRRKWTAEQRAQRDAECSQYFGSRVPGVAVTVATDGSVRAVCPAGATFDAAEALRLELVAGAPPGVTIDVEIAPGGVGSAEDQAGRRLFGELQAARVACGCSSPELGACSTCSPEHEAYCNGFACAGCNPPTACACHGGPR